MPKKKTEVAVEVKTPKVKTQKVVESKTVSYVVTFKNGTKVFADKGTAENYAEVVHGTVNEK